MNCYFNINMKFNLHSNSMPEFKDYLLSINNPCSVGNISVLSREQQDVINKYIQNKYDELISSIPERFQVQKWFMIDDVKEIKTLPKVYNFAFGFYDDHGSESVLMRSVITHCDHITHDTIFEDTKSKLYDFFRLRHIQNEEFDFYLGNNLEYKKQYCTDRIKEEFIPVHVIKNMYGDKAIVSMNDDSQ